VVAETSVRAPTFVSGNHSGHIVARDRDANLRAIQPDDVDRTPVREARDDHSRDRGQGRLDLERRGERDADLREEALASLALLDPFLGAHAVDGRCGPRRDRGEEPSLAVGEVARSH